MTKQSIIISLLALTLWNGCQQPAPSALSDEDKAAIRATSERWLSAVRDGRWDDAASTYTEDAIIWFNGDQIVGRDSIRAFLQAFPSYEGMEMVIDTIYGRGDLAVVSGHSTSEVDGRTVVGVRYLDTRLRQPNGTWLYHRDMVQPLMPPPGEEQNEIAE